MFNGIAFNGMAFSENEEKTIQKDAQRDSYYAEKIKKNKIKTTHKESSFKSIIQDIQRGLYYVEKMNNLSTSDIKNIKEKLVKFKNESFNNNSKIKKHLKECKDIKYIRFSFHKDKNQKSDFYKTEKMKNKTVSEIKIQKDLDEYKGIKDIRYLLNDNIYEDIMEMRYLFNGIAFKEDYHVKNVKSEFKNLSNNLVKAYTKDIRYMVDHINNSEKPEERPRNLEDIKDKFIAYSDYLPFGILSKSSYIDLKKIKIVSFVIFHDEYKILKAESRIMVKSLRILKMAIFLRFLREAFKMHYNGVIKRKTLRIYKN